MYTGAYDKNEPILSELQPVICMAHIERQQMTVINVALR